jgi:two-component sensor histidine kinase
VTPVPVTDGQVAEPVARATWWPFANRRWEAADTVITLVSALIFIIFAVFAALCVQGYATSVNSAKARAQTGADIVGQETRWLVGAIGSALDAVDAKLSMLPATLEVADKADLDTTLRSLPIGSRLAIYDAQGFVLPTAGAAELPADISQMDFFATLPGENDWVVLPQDDRAAEVPPVIVFARALGTDVFAGAALLSISADVLRQFHEPLNLGPDSSVNIVRSDGWMISRDPPLAGKRNIAETSPFWPEVSTSETGTYTATSQVDGVTRVVGYRNLTDLGLVVYATISQDTIVRNLWTSIWIVSALLVPFALVLFAGSLWTARLLRRSASTQRTLAKAVEHNDVLFREIHHRVKNNLQSVASLLQMQPIPREIKTNMGQRIAAMSAVHEHIYRSGNFETVHVKDYIQTLLASIRAGHDPNVQVVADLNDLPVDKDAATPLGLILNEVASNAFKHAFADGREGKVTVRLARTPEGMGQLTVEDNGVGFDPQVPAKGIGRRLIGALTQQLGGESSFETAPGGGSLFTLTFPLALRETAR